MLVDFERLIDAYRTIKARWNECRSTTNVALFVAMDCDAICAASILQELLRSDFIPFVVYPVAGYQSMLDAKASLDSSPEARSLVLINCGAAIDIDAHLDPLEDSIVYIFDSHRPLHLTNVKAQHVWVFDDDAGRATIPEIAFEEGDGDEDDEDAEDASQDSDDSENSDDDAEYSRGRRRRLNEDDAMAAHQRRERMRRSRAEIAEYYKTSYFGASASVLAYQLAVQLGKDTNELLWLAIVGLTDHFVHERVDAERYKAELDTYLQEVNSKNVPSTDRLASEQNRIVWSEEMRLMLYRHWTLYDSMYHSSFMAARLGIWQEAGLEQLRQLITKMGLPHHEVQQKYSLMSASLRDKFTTVLQKYKKEFKVDDIFYGSFVKQHNYNMPLSAADVVYAITALLEFGRGPMTTGLDVDNVDDLWQSNFHDACAALTCSETLQAGIEKAIALQKSVVRAGTAIIVKKQIVRTDFGHYVLLDNAADADVFTHPLALLKLALFLVEALRQHRGRQQHDLMICVFNEKVRQYLIAGVMGHTAGTSKNKFGSAYLKASQLTRARVVFDSFDANVISVQREDLQKFMRALHSEMS